MQQIGKSSMKVERLLSSNDSDACGDADRDMC